MGKRAEVWTISTRKGGVLKTTITVNLAGVLSQNAKVLIVDLDSQGNVLVSFGENPDACKLTIKDLMLKEHTNPQDVIVSVHENIDVLPANDDMGDFEFQVIPRTTLYPDPFSLLKNAIKKLQYEYDYILIDTPPNFGLIQGNALMIADKVIVPFQPESYSMRSLVKILETIETFKQEYNPKLELQAVVATLVDMRTSLHCEIMEEARKFCRKKNIPLTDTIIPKSIRYPSTIAYNRLPATLAYPNNKMSDHYYELLEEVQHIG